MGNFEEYTQQSEPNKREKAEVWKTAIGLQQVDGLKPSGYLIATARQNIEGDITIEEVKQLIDSYYKQHPVKDTENRTEEADKVSARIAQILGEKTFSFSPAEYLSIHRRLFQDIYTHAGKIRDYNITKQEWVLNGETVLYASAESLKTTMEYDFRQEKQFSYRGLNSTKTIQHIADFVSGLWQIHPFGEGNTRTTAVFTIKYLRTFGFEVNNSLFEEHSWYFRNALVRANFNNLTKNIHATKEYLLRFFSNLLLGENHILKNREMLVNFQSAQNIADNAPKSNICTLNCTLEEHFVLEFLKTNPKATQKDIAINIKKSERTVKTITSSLQQKDLLERKNGKRNGFWLVKNN
ncbi:MAG: Fic family protein [Prolixibacteraceae bacterium]|nr:Fic family protein [Prolixibacteraceae bacterium]